MAEKTANSGKLVVMGLKSAGVLLMAAALALSVYNFAEDRKAALAAATAGAEVSAAIEEARAARGETASGEDAALTPLQELYRRFPDMEMPTKEIDGERYIGELSVPSVDLQVPVMSEWSYRRLRKTPCRYAGSAYRDNLVIAGHNYRSQFSKLKRLSGGEELSFTDMDGNVFRYRVAELEQLSPTAVEEMTAGEYALTLFTCTTGGSYRFAVRCERIPDGK